MAIKQISTFIENRPGRLYEITSVLSENKIDIKSHCIADTSKYGVLRMIVADPSKTADILTEKGFTATLSDVIAVVVDDVPGGLNKLLGYFDKEGLSVEYMYAFIGKMNDNKAVVVIKASSNSHAEKICAENGFKLLTEKDVAAL